MYEVWNNYRVCAFGSANSGQVVYESDSKPETEEKDHVEKPEPKPDDPTPTKFESIEQVMSLLPMAGVDDILGEAQLVRIQNPLSESDDLKRVGTAYKYRRKTRITQLNKSRSKVAWLSTDQYKNAGDGMYVCIKSSDLGPKLSIGVDFLRKEETASADGVQQPRHSSASTRL